MTQPPPGTASLRAVIVDDEELGRAALRAALARDAGVSVVAECANGIEAIETIRRLEPDVAFLDVQMPEVDGFGVIFGVGIEHMPAVVMVTAHDTFALRAFEVHAIDYLLKPFTRERLADAVRRVRAWRSAADAESDAQREALSKMMEDTVGDSAQGDGVIAGSRQVNPSRILVRQDDRIRFIAIDTIDYFEADRAHVHLHVGKEKHSVRRPLREVLAWLDPGRFVRIHRSIIVNVERIREVQPWFNGDYVAVLTTGAQLRVSRFYRDGLLRPAL